MQIVYSPELALQPTAGILVSAGRQARQYRTYDARPSLTQGSRPWLCNMTSLSVSFPYSYLVAVSKYVQMLFKFADEAQGLKLEPQSYLPRIFLIIASHTYRTYTQFSYAYSHGLQRQALPSRERPTVIRSSGSLLIIRSKSGWYLDTRLNRARES